MNFTEIINRLEIEWDTNGFFDHLRRGQFDREKAKEILAILRTLDFIDEQPIPKRLVSLLWYLPSFLSWQSERVSENAGNQSEYQRFVTDVLNLLETALGVP